MKKSLVLLALFLLPVFAVADTTSGTSSTDNLLANLFNGCWSCGVINALGAIGFDFADKVYQTLASSMTVLVGLGMALWLLLFAARLLLPFGPPPASGHWNAGAVKLFKCMIVLVFLAASGPFWSYVFTPIFTVGVGIATQLAKTSDAYENTLAGTTTGAPNGSSGSSVDYCQAPVPNPTKIVLSQTVQPLYNAFTQIDCPLSQMQSEYAKGILVGVAVMGETVCTSSILSYFTGDKNPAAFITSGLALIMTFGWGFLVFPILVIDSIARVILVAATAPVAVASILFKPTAKIAERSIWSLIHCGFTLMFGAVIAGLGKATIAYALSSMASPGGTNLSDWSSLSSALENSCSDNFAVDFSTSPFYVLVGTAIITSFMMRRASHLAGELTGISGNLGVREGLGAMAGAVGKAIDKGVGGVGGQTVKNIASLVSGRKE